MLSKHENYYIFSYLCPSFFKYLISHYHDGPDTIEKYTPPEKKAIPPNVDYPVQIASLHPIPFMSKCFSIFANVLPTPSPALRETQRAGTKEDNAWLFALSSFLALTLPLFLKNDNMQLWRSGSRKGWEGEVGFEGVGSLNIILWKAGLNVSIETSVINYNRRKRWIQKRTINSGYNKQLNAFHL